jgi:hypothetical protein
MIDDSLFYVHQQANEISSGTLIQLNDVQQSIT